MKIKNVKIICKQYGCVRYRYALAIPVSVVAHDNYTSEALKVLQNITYIIGTLIPTSNQMLVDVLIQTEQ